MENAITNTTGKPCGGELVFVATDKMYGNDIYECTKCGKYTTYDTITTCLKSEKED
jgi:hypothetical protein